ncbi:MAG: hypothetical protein EZS28_026496, partial [Streblomastix strix]
SSKEKGALNSDKSEIAEIVALIIDEQ